MARSVGLQKLTGIASRFGAFVAECHPFALDTTLDVFEAVTNGRQPVGEAAIEAIRPLFRRELSSRLHSTLLAEGLAETTPRVTADTRLAQAREQLLDDCDGFLRRAAIEASLTAGERREILRGMILTRATDNRLKTFFNSGEVRYAEGIFQGKGFRSLGQEAIYAAAIRLKRGAGHRTPDGRWEGDVVAPVIRDLGVTLAMKSDPATVRMVLNAQMAKAGPPSDGKDLNVGDLGWGIFPPAAPLTIATLTMAGMALAFWRDGSAPRRRLVHRRRRLVARRVARGDQPVRGAATAGHLLPRRTIRPLSRRRSSEQSAVRVFADKAAGYGIPGITLDGNDPDSIAAAFAWAAERARAGLGPTLIELVTMRMCGHAHHDDMLYLGRDPHPSWEYPAIDDHGYVDHELYAYWSGRDPIGTYAARLEAEGLMTGGDVEQWRAEADALVEREARAIIDLPWPAPEQAGVGVFEGEVPRTRVEALDPRRRATWSMATSLPPLEPGPPFDPKGRTMLDAIALGLGDALRADPRVFVYGEDVGGQYGNAFLLLRPLLETHGDRIINSPLAEGAVLGVCVGAALAGQRPIGEIQFNDFVATGFNQLVNNAAKTRYRWGGGVPMVVRMPFGGLRHAGPYHSQSTEAWFYRTPGLKIVVPSTPHDARALLAAAIADPDPVLFYEHIALYRDPRIKQTDVGGSAGRRCRSAGRRCDGPETTWPSSRGAHTSTSPCGSRSGSPNPGLRPACST